VEAVAVVVVAVLAVAAAVTVVEGEVEVAVAALAAVAARAKAKARARATPLTWEFLWRALVVVSEVVVASGAGPGAASALEEPRAHASARAEHGGERRGRRASEQAWGFVI